MSRTFDFPITTNHQSIDRVLNAARAVAGEAAVTQGGASMGSEDFACFTELVPGAHLRIGSGAPGRSDVLHNSDYQPDEGSIAVGVRTLSRAALELLQ